MKSNYTEVRSFIYMGQKKAVKAAQVQSEKVYRGKVYTKESYNTVN